LIKTPLLAMSWRERAQSPLVFSDFHHVHFIPLRRLRCPERIVIRAFGRALLAGIPALATNFLLLHLCDRLGIVTARGGFQRLAKIWFSAPLTTSGVSDLWTSLHLPAPDSPVFIVGFKIAVGLGMAVVYPLIEPLLRGPWWTKALTYALFVWLLNAALVLPLLGEGFAGIRSLTPGGMAAFAGAHTAFFVVLGALYSLSASANEPLRSKAL
jgi:hypothetical protein